MQTSINELVTEVKQATDYQINKKILREKIETDLHMPYNNGLFKIGPEILAFASTWPDDVFYLEDTYGNPIEINKYEFLDQARRHYQSVMNTWHQQHEQIKRIRKV